MSYTNSDMITNFIRLDELSLSTRRDYPATLTGSDWVDLPGAAISGGSVAVKTEKANNPYNETLTLDDIPVALSGGAVVPHSMTIASDSSLGQVYSENADYLVDYDSNTITRLGGGSISSGSSVVVWYFPYQTYIEDQDYQVDYVQGRLKRLSGGDINSGQKVLVDFDLSVTGQTEEIINAAVGHANGMVEARVDPNGQFGADPLLQSAATFLAVSIVCRIAASIDLSSGSTTRQKADSWLSLSSAYRRDFEEMIKDFRPESGRLNPPTLT